MSELRCTKCDLYKNSTAGNSSAVKLDGSGSRNADILILGGNPGAEEIRQKKVFSGQAGQLLRKYALSVGITENNAYFTYAIRCRPQDGKSIKESELRACLGYLDEEIAQIKPKVIVALGSTACKAVGMNGMVTGTHGAKSWSDKYNCWMMPSYHPAYVMGFTNEAPQRSDFVAELGAAKRLVNQGEVDEKVTYKVCRTIEDIVKAADYLVRQEWFSFDIETTNNDFLRSKIPCIQFSAKKNTAIIIPWEYPQIFPKQEDQDKIKEQVTRIMSCPAKKAAQYGKYDLTHLFGHGVPVKGYAFDTMLAHYLLDENGLHNLGLLIRTYTGMAEYKDMMEPYFKKTRENGDNCILDADPELVFEYSGKDADGTFRLISILHDQLVLEGLDTLFYKIVMPLAYVLAQMEFTGITVDKEYVESTANIFSGKLKALNCSLQREPSAVSYVEDIYQAELREYNAKLNKKNRRAKKNPKGSASTDADTLAELAKITKHKLLEDLIDYRTTKKMQDYIWSYKALADKSLDGRIHTTYHQAKFGDHGTTTGRLASSNPNLQNVPSLSRNPEAAMLVRNCLIAKPNYVLIEADYGQVEFRIWAHDSKDPLMIEYVNNPEVDVHKLIASKVYGVTYENVSKPQRTFAKGVVYGLMYGRGTYSIALEFGLPQVEAERVATAFFGMFPKASAYLENNVAFVKKNGYIVNMFGRKRRLDGAFSLDEANQAYAERQARNFCPQSGAADIIYTAMAKLYRMILQKEHPMRMLLQVHDSIVVETPEDKVKESCQIIHTAMTTAVALDVNLTVDFKVGRKFGEMDGFELIL